MTAPIVFIDLDRTIFDYDKAHKEYTEKYPDIEYPQSIKGFFQHLEPIEYALSCIAQIEDAGYDIRFATAPSIKNRLCWSEKAESIYDYFGEEYLNKLNITPDKSVLKGSYLIDDLASGKGQELFEGELLQLGSKEYPTWIDITAYLLSVQNNSSLSC